MTPKSTYLSVVIPAFNEERRLPRTLDRVIRYLQKQSFASEIIVVTDGSSDRTADVAREWGYEFPDLRVMEFSQNRGKGFGVKQGMLSAKGKFRLFMDADYAVPIDYVDQCLNQMIAYKRDIVIGSRTAAGASFEQSQPFLRQQLAVLFGLIQHAILRLPYRDTQCGFKLFTAESAEKYFPLLRYECAYFDAELLYIAHQSGADIGEVGVTWRHDNETRLPIGMSRSLDLLRKLFKIQKMHSRLGAKRDSLRLMDARN